MSASALTFSNIIYVHILKIRRDTRTNFFKILKSGHQSGGRLIGQIFSGTLFFRNMGKCRRLKKLVFFFILTKIDFTVLKLYLYYVNFSILFALKVRSFNTVKSVFVNLILFGRWKYFSHIPDQKTYRKNLVPRAVCPDFKILKKFVRVTRRIFEICTLGRSLFPKFIFFSFFSWKSFPKK